MVHNYTFHEQNLFKFFVPLCFAFSKSTHTDVCTCTCIMVRTNDIRTERVNEKNSPREKI